MKKIVLGILFICLTICGFAAEKKAGIGMYAKAELGYSFWAPEINDVYCESNCFDITPTFGIFPLKDNRKFALEASVDMNFGGGKNDLKTTVIAPQVMALFYIPLDSIFKKSSLSEKLLPFAGAGFSIPIQKVEVGSFSESVTGFVMNMQLGCMFKINDKIGITTDLNSALLKPWNWSVKAGAMYIIK